MVTAESADQTGRGTDSETASSSGGAGVPRGPRENGADVGGRRTVDSEPRPALFQSEDRDRDVRNGAASRTTAIWERHGIGRMYDLYTHNVPQHGMAGTRYGREQVIADVIQMQAAFPELRLLTDDVVWTGNDVDGYRTSHRCTLVGRNTGHSIFGSPTGRQVAVRWCIQRTVREGRIREEWAFNDELSLIRQLGLPLETTIGKLTPPPLDALGVDVVGQVERIRGQATPEVLAPEGEGGDVGDLVRRVMHRIWNWRRLDRIDDYFVDNFRYHGASGRERYGRAQYAAYVLSVLAMFPDAAMHVDDLYWNGNETDGYRTAVRWTLLGTHTGPGGYGEPTNRQIRMQGISQHRIYGGRFVEEWTLFNEFQVLQYLWCGR